MTQIDLEAFKRVNDAKLMTQNTSAPPQLAALRKKHQQDIANILRNSALKLGLPVDELDVLLKDQQTERRQLVAALRAANAPSAAESFRQKIDNLRRALQIIAVPYETSTINLDTAELIYESPTSDSPLLISETRAPFNNIANVAGAITCSTGPGESSTRQFLFNFLFRNPSQYAAVINVFTALELNGTAEVQANSGFFSGDTNTLDLSATMRVMRWTGWGVDPQTGKSLAETDLPLYQANLYQGLANLTVTGAGLFDGGGAPAEKDFAFQQFPLSANLIAVPGSASILFQVILNMTYSIQDGKGTDAVTMDFADEHLGHRVFCANMEVQFLTPIDNISAPAV